MENNFKEGLQWKPIDKRNFKTGRVFGSVPLTALINEDFEVQTGKVKNQKQTDYCTGYATTLASEIQEGEELNPEFQFAAIKKVSGDPDGFGAGLLDAMKAAVKYGSLPQYLRRFDPEDLREEIVKFANYTAGQLEEAKIRRKHSFFEVTGPYDTFDNIRMNLQTRKEIVVTGATWSPEWGGADGIIPKEYGEGGIGHCFVFKGQKTINGEIYLVIQNSLGEEYGDKGCNYMPREVVNKECVYGSYIFVDLPKEEAKVLNDWKLSLNWRWFAKIIVKLKQLINL